MSLSATPSSFSVEDILTRHSAYLQKHFENLLSRYPKAPPRLIESIAYSLYAGGKRLRPALIMESCAACRGDQEAMRSALCAAAAMELIHTFSLVHDDLPAMDNDDLRRGRPTNHKVYGEALAILAGDAMMTVAFEMLATDTPPAIAPQLIRELASASGCEGMIGGQVLDMEGETKRLSLEELQRLHRMKTGALLTCSCRLGAISAGANHEQLDRLTLFGAQLGLAFQIVDDVLDETSTPEQMGKATKKDAAKGKNTYPVLLGIEKSLEEARKALDSALGTIAPFGEAAAPLRSIAHFVVERSH